METDENATDALLRDLAGAGAVSTDSFVDRLVERLRRPLWVAVHDAAAWPKPSALPPGAEVVDCGGGATAVVFEVSGVEAARGVLATLARGLPGGARLVVAVGLGATGASLDGPVFDAVRRLWRSTAALGPGVYFDAASVTAAPGPCAPGSGAVWRLATPARRARAVVLALAAAGVLAAGLLLTFAGPGAPTTPAAAGPRFEVSVERVSGLRGAGVAPADGSSAVLHAGDAVVFRVEKGASGRLTLLVLDAQGARVAKDPEGRPVLDRLEAGYADRLVSDGAEGEAQLAAVLTPAPLGEGGVEALRAAVQAAGPAERLQSLDAALTRRFGAGVSQVLTSPLYLTRP